MNIFVCSPFRDPDPEIRRRNVRIAKAICRKTALDGDIPFASHLHYPRFLNEEGERAIGIKCSLSFLEWWAEELRFYPPVLTDGMESEIIFAQKCSPAVRCVSLPLDFLNDADSIAYLKGLEEEECTVESYS